MTDANGQSATQATSISISAGVSTTFSAPPSAAVGGAYSDTLTATGGTAPYTWSVNAGTLPPGITLSAAGVLSGTPTTTGSYPFTVNVTDANKGVATASITLVVTAAADPDLPGPAVRGDRHGLHRHAHRHRRHHPLYLLDKRGDAPGGPHAERVHRGRVRHPDDGRAPLASRSR